jgi:hypothetical protein
MQQQNIYKQQIDERLTKITTIQRDLQSYNQDDYISLTHKLQSKQQEISDSINLKDWTIPIHDLQSVVIKDPTLHNLFIDFLSTKDHTLHSLW